MKAINDYTEKRANYYKVDCDIDIAYKMFITQYIDKAMIEMIDKIMERVFWILPTTNTLMQNDYCKRHILHLHSAEPM